MMLEELHDVVKLYSGGIVALREVTLGVREHEVLGIVGPNAAGKTTLLRIMALLDRPTDGCVLFKGEKVTAGRIEGLRKRITMVFQRTVMLNTTVFKNVAYGLRLRGISGWELENRVRQSLEAVGLRGMEQREARGLSGGEQQLVAIARALAIEPELLILDEPTANLDPVHAAKIEQLLLEQRHQMTIVHSTQSAALAAKLSDRVAFLLEGRLVQVGTVDDVLIRPASAQVARLVGFENILEGKVTSIEDGIAKIDVGGLCIEAVSSKQGPCTVAIRPEDAIISKKPLKSSMRNAFRGRIVRVADVGSMVRIVVDVQGLPITAVLTRRSFQDLGLRHGDDVLISFKASCVHVF